MVKVHREEEKVPAPGGQHWPTAHETPFGSLFDLRGQVDRLFDSFLEGFGRMAPHTAAAARMPMSVKVDVSESDDDISIRADLPGLEEKDIDVSVSGNVLTITGEKKAEHEEEDKGRNYHLVERSSGSFSRSFHLPETVDQDRIAARFEKGVLTLTLPKTEQAKQSVKKIEVTGGK